MPSSKEEEQAIMPIIFGPRDTENTTRNLLEMRKKLQPPDSKPSKSLISPKPDQSAKYIIKADNLYI